MQRFGEPALLEGERVLPDTQRDISAFGFAVGGAAQQVHWEDSGGTDDEDAEAELSFQQVSHLPAAPQTSSGVPREHAGGNVSVTHAQVEQPEQPQLVVQPTGGAPLRWWNRTAAGPLYAGGDGLHYPLFPGGSEVVSAPLSANALALAGSDCDSSEADEEFNKELAARRAACASEEVVAAAPAVGGRACGVGHSTLAAYYPKWLLVSTLLLCVTAVGALQVTSASRPGGAFPAGLDLGMPLERTRVRLVAGGAFPSPPYDSPSPRPLDALEDSLTVALDPEVMTAYRQGFLAALRLRDSPEAVPGAGGTAAGDAPRTVVQPPGGEAHDLRRVHAELGHQQLRDAMRRLGLVVQPGGGLAHDPDLEAARRDGAAGDAATGDEDEDEDDAAVGAGPADTAI